MKPTASLLIGWVTTRLLVLLLSARSVDPGVLLHDPGVIWSWANNAPVDGEVPALGEYPGIARMLFDIAAWPPSVVGFSLVWMLLFLAVDAVVLVLLNRENRAAAWFWIGAGAALGPLTWLRFDLLTGLLVLVAVLERDRRPVASGVVWAVAVLLKLWPAALVLLLLPGRLSRRWVLGAGSALAGGLALDVAVNGPGSLASPWVYQGDRGIHVESLWALPWLVRGDTTGADSLWEYAFRSVQLTVDKPIGVSLASAFVVLGAGIMAGLLIWRTSDKERLRPTAAAAIVVTAVVANTVFSPQYVLWFAPVLLLAFARQPLPRAAPIMLLGVAALTQLIWPWGYAYLLDLEPWAVALLATRNALVVFLGVLLWTALARGSSRSSSATGEPLPSPASSTATRR